MWKRIKDSLGKRVCLTVQNWVGGGGDYKVQNQILTINSVSSSTNHRNYWDEFLKLKKNIKWQNH